MKSFKTILSLSIAASTCAALIACNKSGGNDPQPPPPPVQPLNQPPVFNPGPLNPSQGVFRPVMKPQQLTYVKCFTGHANYSSLQTSPIQALELPIDPAKPLNQEIPYMYSTSMGKLTLNVQPDVVDANGNPTSLGYMEFVLSDLSGSGASTLRGNLDSHLNLKIDDRQREKYFSIDCSLEMKEGQESISIMDVGNANATYTCSTSLPQLMATPAPTPTAPIGTAGAVEPFTTKSKPRVLVENASQSLKLANSKEKSGYILVNDERKSQNRSIEWSVRYGQAFLLTTNSSSAVSASILCQPAVNATQQK